MKSNFKILLVEDNDGDIRILRELLGEQSDISIDLDVLGSMKELEESENKDSYDILILDLGLPDSSGLETFDRAKSICSNNIPFIILTGLRDNEAGLIAVNKGAQDYLVKGSITSENLVKSIIYSFERNRLSSELGKQLSEKEKTENELIASKERLDIIASGTTAVMYTTRGDGITFDYLHEAFLQLTGYSIHEISDLGFETIIKEVVLVGSGQVEPKDLSDLWEEKTKKELSIEYLIQTKDGTFKWISDKSYPVGHIDSQDEEAIGILLDISDSKEAEIELVSEKNRSDQLFSNSPVAIVQLDKGGKILNANAGFKKIFGYEISDVIGRQLHEIIVPDEMLSEAEELNRDVFYGLSVNDISFRKRADESLIYVSISGMPIKIKGEVVGAYAMYNDLTKQKLAEEALIKARDKARESDRLKTAFLHNISHEIRTPMNAIVGFSALLADPDQPDETKETFIETIVSSSGHLLSIINDIVEISNIEANLLTVNHSEFNLESLLNELSDIFLPKAGRKNIQLKLEIEAGNRDLIIISDRTKLYQVLSNLIANAIKFSNEGEVRFGFNRNRNILEFFVSDTGIGIPDDKVETIFDRFFQVDNSETRQYEGTGLGLSISKSYVDLLGGNIWVKSDPGKGSVFYFTLPLESIEGNSDGDQEESIQEQADNGQIDKRKILVAEDVESNFRLIEFYLSGKNIEVVWKLNGKETVDTFMQMEDIDLVLMDIKMPVMDGYEAMKLIRMENPDIPIIAQTAFADDIDRAMEYGCNDFLSKPFKKSELLESINKYLKI
jgi:PAS domain S-box-containing protein